MKFLKACVVTTLVLAPAAAFADDASYCKALVDKYRTVTGGTQNDQTVAAAMEQCAKGNPAAGIPVMEKALKDQKATLPPRT